MLPPGSTIGILGGGQLGRMLAVAAALLANEDAALADRLVAWRETQTNSVAPVPVREG